MFAPKVAKPPITAALKSIRKITTKRLGLGTSLFGASAVAQAHFLQSAIGNQAVLRLRSQRGFSPIRRRNYGDPGSLERFIVQRQPDSSVPSTIEDQESLPAGAPAVIEGEVAPASEAAPTEPLPAAANDGMQPSVQRSLASFTSIRRQPARTPPATRPQKAVPQALTWANFAPARNRVNGMSAQTAYRWRANGTVITVAFDPSKSWSVVADQTPALLRHEQYHLNLAVLIANKANAAAGTMGASDLISAFQTALIAHELAYDADTDHSRNTSLETRWEQDIDAGVPEFPITP